MQRAMPAIHEQKEDPLRIALLSGADKNAGDFLIVDRAEKLIKARYPESEIKRFDRNRPLDDSLDEINDYDFVVFGGGPGYLPEMYPRMFPLVGDLASIKPPMMALGMGSYAPSQKVENVRFSERSRMLLDRLDEDGCGLGCRDKLTERLLRANGYTSGIFTGCPAWYDLERVDQPTLQRSPARQDISRVAISDPARLSNIPLARKLIRDIREEYRPKELVVVFHRGWMSDAFTDERSARAQDALRKWAVSEGCEVVDISYSSDGFSVYDTCDMHVGFRVHAHLYNLSRRKASFLFEEDGRGYGANEALGYQTHLSLSEPVKIYKYANAAIRRMGSSLAFGLREQEAVIERGVAFIGEELDNGLPETNNACCVIRDTYPAMESHLDGIARKMREGD